MKSPKTQLLESTQDFKGFRESDKIIAFLADPDQETKLSQKDQERLKLYQMIHGLRQRFKDHKFIIGQLKLKGRNERQARYDIAEAEYIFGASINVSRQYELAFLIECSRKNISRAFATKDPLKITKALDLHHKLLGPEVDESKLPDFSKFEQHNYNLVLPKEVLLAFTEMISKGALNLSEIVPPAMLQIKANDDTQA